MNLQIAQEQRAMDKKKIFQVECISILDNNKCYVEGRFVEGEIIEIKDFFKNLILNNSEKIPVELEVIEIVTYGVSLSCLYVGLTARLLLAGTIPDIFKQQKRPLLSS
jgi:hypothetical protein